jgi:transcriptional regulator with XRE-family HTH domain
MKSRLEELRKEKQISLRKLGKEAGVSFSAISRAEAQHNAKGISTDTLVKLCRYFKCSTDYFLGLSDKRNVK